MQKNNNKNIALAFESLSSKDVGIAGGKGASLGEMTRADIPVPPGFVVLSSAFEKFLEETDLSIEIDTILGSVKHKEIHTVENASEKIHDLILNAEIPKEIVDEIQKFFKILDTKYVAVRSSATAEDSANAAWAGQLESYLNTTEDNLLKNVKKCWASLFTPRAIYYRFDKKLHKQKISVAVVIQKMIQSEMSGIAFSVHPVTQDRNQIIIEAGFGLGEAIVSGAITPDSYVIEKDSQKILDKNINTQTRALVRSNAENVWVDLPKEKGEQQVLTDEEIIDLAELIKRIESHYAFPVDIEWARENEQFYVVQSRPITTLSNIEKAVVDVKKKTFIDSLKKSKKWVPVVERHICLLIRDLILNGEKSAVFNEALGITIPPIGDAIVRDHVFSPIESIENTNHAMQLLVDKHGYKKLMEIAKSCLERAKELHQYLESSENIELTDCLKNFKKLYTRVTCYLLIVVFSEKFLEKQVENLIKEKTGEENKRYFESIVYVRKFNRNTEELVAILELSKLIKTKGLDINSEVVNKLLKKHSEEYGWLGTRWQFENSWNIDDIKLRVKRYLDGNPEKQLSDVLQPREEAEIATKEFIQKFNLSADEKEFIDLVKEFVFLRTFRTESLARANYLVKPFLQEASEILKVDREDIVFLSVDEIIDSINKRIEYTNIIKQRKNGHYMILCDDVIEIFTEDERLLVDELNIFNFGIGEGDKITGQIAWRGIAKGKVKIVKDQKDISKVKDGDILVAVMTFPNYIPAMEKASAFVTDEGGILCHAAIVSREMKKPCIIGTKTATKLLKDGDLIEVDANNGFVSILQ